MLVIVIGPSKDVKMGKPGYQSQFTVRPWAGRPRSHGLILGLSLIPSIQTGLGPMQPFIQWALRALFLIDKQWPEYVSGHSL